MVIRAQPGRRARPRITRDEATGADGRRVIVAEASDDIRDVTVVRAVVVVAQAQRVRAGVYSAIVAVRGQVQLLGVGVAVGEVKCTRNEAFRSVVRSQRVVRVLRLHERIREVVELLGDVELQAQAVDIQENPVDLARCMPKVRATLPSHQRKRKREQ